MAVRQGHLDHRGQRGLKAIQGHRGRLEQPARCRGHLVQLVQLVQQDRLEQLVLKVRLELLVLLEQSEQPAHKARKEFQA